MTDEIKELRALWTAAVQYRRQSDVLRAQAEASAGQFNTKLAEMHCELMVPPGYSIDVLGDGQVKPDQLCAKVILPEKPPG